MTAVRLWRDAVLALAAVLLAVSSGAQEAPKSPAGLEEIVVTARKRAENLQDVPISLNVIDGDLLDLSQENEISRISKFDPSFRFIDSGADVARGVSIRGVGTNTFSRGVEQSVGTAIDGVVADTLASSLLDFSDVERIEVLRGPQGMLFGKNSSAGLLNIVTRKPTWEWEGGADTSWSEANEVKLRGFLSGPITDQLATRFSVSRTTRDAYLKNLGGRDHNRRKELAVRFKLLWQPIEDLSALFSYSYAERDQICCSIPAAELVPGELADQRGAPFGRTNDTVDNSSESTNATRINTYSLQANWELGDYLLTSISSYTDGYNNADARHILPFETGGFLEPNFGASEVGLITQELRIATTEPGFTDWVAGFYYYNKRESFVMNRVVDTFPLTREGLGPGIRGFSLENSFDYENVSTALFGNITFHITDFARVSAGLRWNYDDVSTDVVVGYDPNAFPRDGSPCPLPNDAPCTLPEVQPGMVSDSRDDHALSWRVIGEYDIVDNVMVFLSIAQGYKGLGANTLPEATTAVQPIIDPEIPTNYELGVKSEWWDNRVRVNGSVFYTSFKDFQTAATRFREETDTFDFALANAEELVTHGVELEIVARPLPNLTLTAVGAYIDSVYEKYTGAPCYAGQTPEQGCVMSSQDLSGTELAFSPDWSYTLSGQYFQPLPRDLLATALISYSWRDDYLSSTTGDPASVSEGYGTADLTLDLGTDDGRFGVRFFVKNLFDEFYETAVSRISAFGINRAHTLAYDYKRRLGVGVRLKF